MFGFPIGNGNAGFNDFVEKFTNNADSGFPKIQQREVFYSVKDGNWNDITIWQTASGRVGFFPTRNDDVYIKTNVLVPTGQNVEAGNVFVGGTIRTQGLLYCFGNFKCVGIFDGSLGGTLILFSNDNYINNFISGISNITYAGDLNQDVMPLNYYDLSFGIFYNSITYGRIGIKKLVSDLIISRNLTITYGRFEVLGYNLTVNGITYYYGPGQGAEFTAAGSGYLLFIGELKVASAGVAIGWDFSAGNPTVECRGGIDLYNIVSGAIKTGTGTWYFTTNNQTIRSTATGGNITFSGPVVMSNVNLTVNLNQTVNLNNIINATNAGNKLTNSGTINFLTDTSVPSMTTGQWDFTTNANTIGYTGNYSATIPSYFTTFSSLTISGNGTKTISTNTTLNGNLTVNGSATGGTFECSNYNLTITGTTTISHSGSSGTPVVFSKNGSGSILFNGQLSTVSTGNGRSIVLSGNPNVEFRGGANLGDYGFVTFNTGTGLWKFSTNNQTYACGANLTYDCQILVSGAITVNMTSSSGEKIMNTTNTIDGDNALSKLLLGNAGGGTLVFGLKSTTTPMTTAGAFDFTTNTNTIIRFLQTTPYTIPYTSFIGLDISTVAGNIHTLSGNTTIAGNLRFYAGILECSTYDLIVSGTTTSPSTTASGLKKSGAGNLLFVGNVNMNTNGAQTFDLSTGNPNVEFRGGFGNASTSNYSVANIKTGTGTWTFSTNNQTLANGNITITFDCQILVSGAITLTIAIGGAATSPFIFKAAINGNNSSSILQIATSAIINYQSSTQPMATGILDTSTNLNTWIYGLNNQNIKGGPTTGAKQVYRNLTLNGTGVKTLQGYCSVLNTYTLTSPATLALNGYTLTNP